MGNVTFSNPCSIFALTSSGYTILVRQEKKRRPNLYDAHLGAHGEHQSAREFAAGPLADGVSAFISLLPGASLTRDSEKVVADVDVDLVRLDAGQVERRGDRVGLRVLVHVHSASSMSVLVGGHKETGAIGDIPGPGEFTPSFGGGSTAGAQEARGERIVKETIELGERIVVETHQRHVAGRSYFVDGGGQVSGDDGRLAERSGGLYSIGSSGEVIADVEITLTAPVPL